MKKPDIKPEVCFADVMMGNMFIASSIYDVVNIWSPSAAGSSG